MKFVGKLPLTLPIGGGKFAMPSFAAIRNPEQVALLPIPEVPVETQRNTPKPAALVQSQDTQFEDDFEPEAIREEDVTSLQIASGIRNPGYGLGMTMLVLEARLRKVLDKAWRDVCGTLDLQDLWTTAQAAQNLCDGACVGLDWLEQFLGDLSAEYGVDPDGAKKLLPKVRDWDLATRWAVVRVVENCLEAAWKRSTTGFAIPNRLIEDEFKKALAVASK